MIRSPNLALLSTNALLVLSLFLVAGCGDGISRATVQGTVTLDGQPIDGGRIMFIAVEKKSGANAVADIKDGKYAVPAPKGPSIGTHKVEIIWLKKTGKEVVSSSDPPNMVAETIQVIPKQYNANSGVKEEIKSGANTFNYDLKSK
jgi:hypothetical protein